MALHERLAIGVDELGSVLDGEGDTLEIELGRSRTEIAELRVGEHRPGVVGQPRAGAGEVADESGPEGDAVGGQDGGAGPDDDELAGAAIDPEGANHAPVIVLREIGDEDALHQVHALGLQCLA